MRFTDDGAGRLWLRDGPDTLAEYVYRPVEPQQESPRPFAVLRARTGVEVTAYRPADHVWHKGLSLALPVVGTHNFWGGPTYVRGRGYVQRPNNGAQVHRAFAARSDTDADADDAVARVDEQLDWIAEGGDRVLEERRALTARAVDDTTWALSWRSALHNVSGATLPVGSPTSEGRPDAGYAGIFWRGPVSFAGCEILGPSGVVGEAARGVPAPWLAFRSPERDAGVLMLNATGADVPWFARATEYAGLSPAPFFFDETALAPEGTLVLAAVVLIGDADVAEHAAGVGASLVVEVRSAPAAHIPSMTEES